MGNYSQVKICQVDRLLSKKTLNAGNIIKGCFSLVLVQGCVQVYNKLLSFFSEMCQLGFQWHYRFYNKAGNALIRFIILAFHHKTCCFNRGVDIFYVPCIHLLDITLKLLTSEVNKLDYLDIVALVMELGHSIRQKMGSQLM